MELTPNDIPMANAWIIEGMDYKELAVIRNILTDVILLLFDLFGSAFQKSQTIDMKYQRKP